MSRKPKVIDTTESELSDIDSPHRVHTRYNNALLLYNQDGIRIPVCAYPGRERDNGHNWGLAVLIPTDAAQLSKLCPGFQDMPYDRFLSILKYLEPIKQVGYFNAPIGGHDRECAVFMSRIPARTYSVGITSANIQMQPLSSEYGANVRYSTWMFEYIGRMVKGEFPTIDVVLKTPNRTEAAVSRNVAIKLYDDDINRWQVYYRQHVVGFLQVDEDTGRTWFKALPVIRDNPIYVKELRQLGLM